MRFNKVTVREMSMKYLWRTQGSVLIQPVLVLLNGLVTANGQCAGLRECPHGFRIPDADFSLLIPRVYE